MVVSRTDVKLLAVVTLVLPQDSRLLLCESGLRELDKHSQREAAGAGGFSWRVATGVGDSETSANSLMGLLEDTVCFLILWLNRFAVPWRRSSGVCSEKNERAKGHGRFRRRDSFTGRRSGSPAGSTSGSLKVQGPCPGSLQVEHIRILNNRSGSGGILPFHSHDQTITQGQLSMTLRVVTPKSLHP